MSKSKSAAAAVPAGHSLGRRIAKHWEYYLLLLIPIVITAVFKYAPIYGVQIAFRDFNPVDGFFGSQWVGLKWFERFFSNYNSVRMIKNTVLLSLYSILWTFPIPIVLSLFINQLRNKKFQRVTQTVIYAPHFISVMVLCGMLRIFLSPTGGLISTVAQLFGAPGNVNYIDSSSAFRTIYISSSVDLSLHEAAKVDGANTWQRILHIDIPVLVPIIVIQLIMSFGSLMNVGFEKAFLLQTPLNKETSEIISTYVYEQGLLKAMYSFSTAVNLFNTAVNIVLLTVVNWVCKRLSDVSFI